MAYDSSASNRLAAVRAAIDKTLNAQTYTKRQSEVQRAKLDHLDKMEQRLMEEDDNESGSNATLQGFQIR